MQKIKTVRTNFGFIKKLWLNKLDCLLEDCEIVTFFEYCENTLGLKYIESAGDFVYLNIIDNKKWCFAILAYNIQYTPHEM